MNIINDFFYTVWKSEPVCAVTLHRSDIFLQAQFDKDSEIFLDKAAIMLSISSANVAQYLQIEETIRILKHFSEYPPSGDYTPSEISAVQCRLLSYLLLKGDMALNKALGQRIEKLRKASVIGYDTARKLISILTLIPEKTDTEEEAAMLPVRTRERQDSYYRRVSDSIDDVVAMLDKCLEDPMLRKNALEIPEKIRNQHFSIGITGVMNAGKSTMLNALLGAEVLGTAVVPETANLTVIKYAEQPHAIVNFWSRQEWEKIEQSAGVMENMQHFVEETSTHFGKDLGSYVTEIGRSEAITVEALPAYTSAAHSDKRCNLVKSVELYTDLEFVQQGVEIVDTPGLDDPVIQREEITKSYLAECDLLCHLMNVGQSATQKDLEFIIESLLYRSVSQLLIVITRIDMVSAEELEEVIAYTKSSIKARLEALGQGRKFEALIARIVFIPIAGKMALLHRTGCAEEALALGYDLQKSGIPAIEAYLREVLFGAEAPKARLILEAVGKELEHIIRSQEKTYSEESILLGQNAEEIAAAFAQYQEEKAEAEAESERLDQKIILLKHDLERYFVILQKGVSDKFKALGTLLKRRIMDDVRYTLRKEKRKPAPERIETMITTGLQDGLIDLLRDYRYQFQKRMDEALEQVGREFAHFAEEETLLEQESAKAFFVKHFDTLLMAGSYTVLITEVNRAITKAGKKQLDALDVAVEGCFADALQGMEETFHAHAEVLNRELLETFEVRSKAPLERMALSHASRGHMLEQALAHTHESGFDTQERIEMLEGCLAVLFQARERLSKEGIL